MNSISDNNSTLLDICKKNVELYFFGNQIEEYFILDIVVEILLSGFKLHKHSVFTGECQFPADVLRKLAEDFYWVRHSAQLRISHTVFVDDKVFDGASTINISSNTVEQFLKLWTLQNLKANCLGACLQSLITDRELLEYYYAEGSFLRSEYHATALLVCLSALELNQSSLLSQIENCRMIRIGALTSNRKQLFSSHPNFSFVALPNRMNDESIYTSSIYTPTRFSMLRKVKSLPCLLQNVEKANFDISVECSHPNTNHTSGDTFTSLKFAMKNRRRSETILLANFNTSSPCDDLPSSSTSINIKHSRTSQPNSMSTTSTSSMSSLTSSQSLPHKSCPIQVIKCDDIKIWTDQSTSTASTSAESQMIPIQLKNSSPINNFIYNLFRIQPAYNCSNSNQEIEATNSNQLTNNVPYFADTALQTDDTGVFNSFRIPYGKKLKSRKFENLFYDDAISYLDYSSTIADTNTKTASSSNDEMSCNIQKSATTRSEQSLTSFLQMVSHNHTELEKENAHFSIAETIISVIEHIKWSKLEPDKYEQNSILVSEQQAAPEISQIESSNGAISNEHEHIPFAEVGENCLEALTAEVVGLSLISKFHNQQWPQISELKWLVSDDDTPQQLLPMPIRKNDEDINKSIVLSTSTRGTSSWAPPRKQIIFTDHPPPNRRELIQKQNNRCAGCGMRISMSYMQSLRYCTYLGKYHCTGCHRNQISAIPAKILHGWDFKCYPVSVFAYRLIDQMYSYPLFYVPDLNPLLYERATELLNARKKRVCLKYAQMFIKLCRFAEKEQRYFDAIPTHITNDPDIWSMSDLINARRKNLQRFIDIIISQCENHIFNCVLCTGRGFLCEFCQKDNVIYPWQNRVTRCDSCGSCFHEKCWKSLLKSCLKCQRINKRQVNIS